MAEPSEGWTRAGGGEGETEPRLMITKIVCENFKSYAGVKELGPFHKVPPGVCTAAWHSAVCLNRHFDQCM